VSEQSDQPRTVEVSRQDFAQLQPARRPFDPAPYREATRIFIVAAFLVLVVAIVVGAGIAFLNGRLREETLITVVTGFIGLFGPVIGFYFGQESTRK